jgi:hypothetical protein
MLGAEIFAYCKLSDAERQQRFDELCDCRSPTARSSDSNNSLDLLHAAVVRWL